MKNLSSENSNPTGSIKGKSLNTNKIELAEYEEIPSETDLNLLNLIAEVIVENIVRKIRNGRNRIHQDQ